jgi:hypothetical protein
MKMREVFIIVSIVLFVLGAITWRQDPNWPWSYRMTNAGLAFFAASFLNI